MIVLPKMRHVFWPEMDVDLDWANSIEAYNYATAVKLTSDEDLAKISPFTEWVRTLWPFPIVFRSLYVGTWDHSNVDRKNPAYCRGFPHRHNNSLTAVSLVIQVPLAGGEAMLEGRTYSPRLAHGLIIGGKEEHGVMRVHGSCPRIALIAQFDNE